MPPNSAPAATRSPYRSDQTRAFLDRRAPADGLAYVARHLSTEPDCVAAWVDGATCALLLGQRAEAEVYARQALAVDPGHGAALQLLARLGRPVPREPTARERLEGWLRSHADLLASPVLDVGTSRSQRLWIDLRARRVTLDAHARVWDASMEQPDLVADLAHLDGVADETFGTIVCTEVLEHVREPDRALRELRRVTRPGGTLLLSVPWFYPFHPCPLDLRRYTLQGLELAVEDAGWTIVERGGLPMPAVAHQHLLAAVEAMTGRPAPNPDSLGWSNWVVVAQNAGGSPA